MIDSVIVYAEEPLESVAHGSGEVFSPRLRRRSKLPIWVSQVMEQLEGLSQLLANWDSYGALAPNGTSIRLAQDFIQEIATFVGVERPSISLSAGGNAVLMWEWDKPKGTCNLDAEVLPGGSIRFAFIDESDESQDMDAITQNCLDIVDALTQW